MLRHSLVGGVAPLVRVYDASRRLTPLPRIHAQARRAASASRASRRNQVKFQFAVAGRVAYPQELGTSSGGLIAAGSRSPDFKRWVSSGVYVQRAVP